MKNTLPNPVPSEPLRLGASVDKPNKIVVPLAVGLGWTADPDYIYQEKMDGCFAVKRIEHPAFGNCTLVGEQMKTGYFYAFDCLQFEGQEIRDWKLIDRIRSLERIFNAPFRNLPPKTVKLESFARGAELLQHVLERGGEGIVRKRLDSPWGAPMEACKRLETFYCVVTGINAGQSVQIARLMNAEGRMQNAENGGAALPDSSFTIQPSAFAACGSVALFGGKADRVRVGSILKIEGFGLTSAGKIREPRPFQDTPISWLVKY
jgi:hypothetical protein